MEMSVFAKQIFFPHQNGVIFEGTWLDVGRGYRLNIRIPDYFNGSTNKIYAQYTDHHLKEQISKKIFDIGVSLGKTLQYVKYCILAALNNILNSV